MQPLPKIGAMVRCVGPSYDAGAVTYNGHGDIRLPSRTESGRIVPGTLDWYRLTRVGGEWVYQFMRDRRHTASRDVSDRKEGPADRAS